MTSPFARVEVNDDVRLSDARRQSARLIHKYEL